MNRLGASKLREGLAEAINRVAYSKERVVLHRHGKDLAAIVPIEDLRLLEELEDASDLKAARKALKEKGSISYKKVRADLLK